MKRLLIIFAFGTIAALAAGLWITRPLSVDVAQVASLSGSAEDGEWVFHLGACASCHATPGGDKTVLAGGREFTTGFGTFVAPNISSSRDHGIGTWSQADFFNALRQGTSLNGTHYFPAFPYASYARMSDTDIANLWAYMATLPASDRPSEPHRLTFPFNLRATVGVWKALYLRTAFVGPGGDTERGRYLVEAIGHCGECHTPRTVLGGLQNNRWMAGAPDPSGKGKVPGITPAQLDWSEADIAYYLETGFTPDFDSAGGGMVAVIEGTSLLAPEDRAAIAAYVKALPPAQ
ncbi:c-type cytochrome [Boseongicola aestuarii]|uniref:Fructose dehydrogenase cytochrome subunit n=1 Tax=Boseongicola aestuarii TaxID=1470561 RepID=A0A238IW79_9RHOB|nr:cytochrome c [Boseongicola aestuarii]SMX22291.1 Fructose dehydrogenase cytochrome subunit precursor [Boseongicola aestuarii]